ncbi:hypothetical protein BC830DRAFT_1131139 [Chytriomyces sp. MP71]|nr:hypothetical protein BC830DRAFT_1131139 [Chytriomyces sp. MP71]
MDAIEQLTQWTLGADAASVPMRAMQPVGHEGRVLRATRPIASFETVVKVRAETLLSASAAKRTPTLVPFLRIVFGSVSVGAGGGVAVDGLMDHFDDHLALCLLIMHAKKCPEDTSFTPYVAALPSAFSNLLCLPSDTLHRIIGTHVEAVVNSERDQMILVLNHVLLPAVRALPGVICSTEEAALPDDELRLILWDSLMWAHAAVASRAFSFRLDSEQSEVFCVPFADLANHSNNPNLVVKGVDPESRTLIVKAKRDIMAGEELTIAYHDNSPNWFLLTHYGFAIEGNPEERVDVAFDDGSEDETESAAQLRARKDSLIQAASENLDLKLGREHEFGPIPSSDGGTSNKGSNPDASQSTSAASGISEALIYSLRLLVANDGDLKVLTAETVGTRIKSPLSRENEANVYQTISLMAQALLDMFPTTLEDDLERQAQPDAGGDERYILVYLIGQKRILRTAFDFCKRNQDMWHMVWKAV